MGEIEGRGEAPAGEVDLYCQRLGDAEIARLLSIVVIPAVEGSEAAATLVRSAAARLVRADGGALPTRASGALAAAVAAVASRTPVPAAVAPGRAVRVWGPPSR
ncbi:MAG TPA: hypothetical protein VLS93_14930 [Anaeromyxobacteraceae bacterium]|nr:hypothetical protein [Anaeromyxobacteraceae bacterium]